MKKDLGFSALSVFIVVCFWQISCVDGNAGKSYEPCKLFQEQIKKEDNGQNISVTKGSIYLDLSSSMQGYISDPQCNIPFTLLQHALHSVLQTSFHHANISEPVFQGFSRSIEAVSVPMKFYAIAQGEVQPRSRFDHNETNIVGVFSAISKQESTLSVIITDGLQDVCSINGVLAPGFDRPEFLGAVNQGLIDKGFGVWLVGIMNHFNGDYYNIIPDRDGRINKKIPVSNGFRPVYFWVICRNELIGRSFVQYLTDDLKRLVGGVYNGSAPENCKSVVQAIELAPGISPDFVLVESSDVHFKISDALVDNLIHVTYWETHPEYKKQGNVKVASARFPVLSGEDLLFFLQGKLEFKINEYSWNSFPSNMWQINTEQIGKIPFRASRDVDGIEFNGPENLRWLCLQFSSDRLIVFDDNDRQFEIPVKMIADLKRGLENCWIKNWSTGIDTTKERVKGKTLYLFDIVSGILENTIGKPKPVACLHLSLQKRN